MLSMFFPPLDLSGFVLVQDLQCTRKLLRVVSRHFLCKYSNFIGDISHFFQLENSKWLSSKSEGKLHYISWILKGGEEVTKPSAYKKPRKHFTLFMFQMVPDILTQLLIQTSQFTETVARLKRGLFTVND